MPDGENWWDSAESIGGEDVAAPGRAVAPPLPAIPEYYQPPAEEPEPIPEWALDSVPISEGFGNLADRHTNNELASDDNEFSGLIAAEIGELRKKEYDLSSRAWRGAQKLPFLGGFLTADSLMDVYHASERYNKGQYWKSDAKLIAAYIAEGERQGDLAWYEKGAEILGDIPGYAVEILYTGGAMSAGRAVVKKTITGIAEKLVKRGALKAFGKRSVARAAAAATRGIGEVGGLAVGGAAMTAVSPWLVAEQTTERAVRNSLAGDDDAFAKALWQGPLSAQIELASEFSGGMALQALGKLPGIKQLKNLVAHNVLKTNPGKTLDDFLKMRDRIGWHGILGELEEERWNEIVNGLTGLSDDYGVIQGIFSNDEGERRGAVEQLGAELLAFSAFGAPFTVANAASYRRGKLTVRKRLEKFVDNQSRGNYSKMHEGTRSLLPLPGQQIEVDGESVEFDPGNKKHREALKPYAERLIQNWDAGIAQTSDEDKAEMVEQVDAFLEAMKGQHTGSQLAGMLSHLEQLRAEENPADAMLREGLSLPVLRAFRSDVAGVPKRAERFSPQELIEQYSTIAAKLSQASEVTREQFAQWTGAELAEGEEQAILDYQNALNSLFGQLQMEQIEPAAEQVAAVSGEKPAVPTPAAEPAAPTPAAEITEEDLNALRSMTPEEAEGVSHRAAGAGLIWNPGIQGLLGLVAEGEATIADREELKRLAAANPEWGTVMAGKLNELRAAEPAAEDPAPTAPEAPEAGAGATVVEAAVGTKFMSGMTRSPKRLREALLAGEPVGVSVLSVDRGNLRVISDTILDLISQAAEQGIPVFIDSGAFGLYDNNIEMPWDEVRSEYLRILEAVPPQFRANLYFVAPDVVGDIQGSIDALVANDWVEFELIQQGARVIYPVPMEKGTSFVDSQGAVSSAADIQWDTNSNQRVIGVPFNKAAWSEKDIVEWVREDKEYRDAHPELDVLPEATFPRIHLLGGGLDAVKSLAEKLNEIEPTITVTGDSTRQRARKGRKDTGMDKDATVPIGSAAKAEAVEEEDTWSTYFKGEKGKGRWTAKSEDHARRVEITAEDGQKYVIFFQAEQIAKVHKDLAEKAGGKFGWFIQWGRSDEENENSDGLHGVFFRTQAELKQWARENIDELAVDLEEEVDEPVPEEAEETTFEEQSWADAVAQEAEGMGQAGEAEREYRSMEDDALGGVAMAAGAPGEIGPTEPPSTDPAIEPSAREMYPLAFPELVELATGIAEGEIQVKPLSGAAGRFKGQEGQFVIVLNREYARNPLEAAAILGHEIGHLVDYLPDETLKRGNVLGRIASFKGTYRKWFINLLERKTETAPRKLRERLKRQATTESATPEEIIKEYNNLLATHGYVSNQEIRNELIALSEWWTPYPEDASESYIAYRESSVELYAQALSVFLNAPKELQNRAPLFWRSFMAFAHTKPEFFSEYQKIQDLLAGDSEELVKHRTRRLADGFLTAEEQILASVAAREAARLSGPEMLMRQLTQGVIDRTAPGKQLAFKAMAKGATTIEAMQMIAMLDELHTMDSPSHALVMRTNREIIEPLNTIAGIADPVLEFGLYVFHRRVIVERADIFNPLGYNPEESSKAIDDQYQRLNRTFRLPDGTETTQFAYLEEQVTRWHNDIVHKEVEKAFESGLIRPETMAEIRTNINNYGAFAVTKFLTDYVDPSIQQQAGTVQEVANPFTATMMKVISMMRVTQINNTKREIVDWMTRYFPEELGEPVDILHGQTSPARRPSPGKDFMIIVVDGQHIAYEVDEYLVKMFQSHDIGMLQGFSRVLSSAVYRTFHPLFVTFNPSFISGNWIRDIQRTHRNLGAQSRRLEHETIEAELQHIRQTEGREPNEAEVAAAQRKGRTMRIGLLDILKARHKLMGWGRVATFLFGKDFKPGPARQFVAGEHVPEIEEAMAEHAYAMSLTDIESQVGGLIPGWLRPEESIREQATRAAQELRDLENPTVFDKFGAKVLPAIGHFLHAFEVAGATTGVTKLLGGIKQYAEAQEVAGKMTGYNLLKARKVETRDRAMITRKDVGTPDFMQRGLSSSLTNGIWMYSKVRWNALHSDYQLLKGHLPKTRAAWMMNQLIWTLAPTTFTKLAAYGALGMLPWGDELEEWYKLFSKYFLDNYDVLPLGTTQVDGKRHAVGLTIPRDETRTFVAQMWGNAIDAVIEGTTDIETQAGSVPKGIQELTDALQTNVMPNVNPWLDIMTTYGQYARGMNPRDKFYKGDVIPRSAWEAGGWESNRKLMAWTVKKFGVLNTMVHPITGPILGDAFDDTEENWKQVTVRSTPILQRFLRVSQRGAQDRHWMAMEEERQDTARFRLQLPTTVREANGRQYLLSHTKHLLDDEGMQELLVLNKWRSMTYMPARERMLEATASGDEQTFNQLREQLSLVTKEVTNQPLENVPDLYLGAIAWQLTNPNFEDPLESHELTLLQGNGRSISDINRLVKMEAVRRNNMERERTEKRTGRRLRPRTVPKITRSLHERLVRARDIFKGKEPRRRRIGRRGTRD